MKKPRLPLLLCLMLVFAGFLLGFFTGRNVDRAPVLVQSLPPSTFTSTEPSQPPQELPQTEPPGPININTATAEQLQTLPGIGPVLAQRIVDYRTENGDFQSVGALIQVSGIGALRLEAIWDLVTTGG